MGVPLATLFNAAFFRFPQDSIIHYVMVNSTLTCNGALSQAIGSVVYGQGNQTIGEVFSAGAPNFADGVLWRDELLNPAAGVISDSKSNQIVLNEFFVHTDTGIGIADLAVSIEVIAASIGIGILESHRQNTGLIWSDPIRITLDRR